MNDIVEIISRQIFMFNTYRAYGFRAIRRAIKLQQNIETYTLRYKKTFMKVYGVPLRGAVKGRAFDRAMMKESPKLLGCKPFWKTIPRIREDVWQYLNWYDKGRRAKQHDRILNEDGPLPYHEYDAYRSRRKRLRKNLA